MSFARKIFLLIPLLLSQTLQSAHLVGGDLSYTCLGNNTYEIRMTVYRDCASQGANFDSQAAISIYDGNNLIVANLDVNYYQRNNLPLVAPNNCTTLPSFACVEKAVYLDTVNLPPNNSGYTISYQRCCRNATISNVPNPDTYGSTYTVDIPPNDNACNSSPEFNAPPPVALCLNIPVNLDLSATEADGDQLVYSLCTPLQGGGQANNNGPNGVMPDPAAPPPYTPLPFNGGFSATNPIPGTPAFSIDPNTGVLTGRPTSIGQYSFAICVEEYRNGQRISTVMRDFQFNVTAQCKGTASVIAGQAIDSTTLCTGETINFKEQCVNTNTYFWDFGDLTTNADTSRAQSPTYTYPDTGTYRVMLVANPNTSCADTTYELFRVFDPVWISFDIEDETCFDVHSFNFDMKGVYSDSATISWDFGGATSYGTTSKTRAPTQLKFAQPGIYPVTVYVEDFKCTDSFTDTIKLYERPKLFSNGPKQRGCPPRKSLL